MLKIADVVEEIALEGSDAITIECLFERLNRSSYGLKIFNLFWAFYLLKQGV